MMLNQFEEDSVDFRKILAARANSSVSLSHGTSAGSVVTNMLFVFGFVDKPLSTVSFCAGALTWPFFSQIRPGRR